MNVDEALEYAKNALDRAFEDWLESERPSGDCESVHRQWDQSFAHQELVDELRPVMALTWEVRRLREENEHLRATQPQQSPWQPIVTPIENGRRVIVASSNRMALFHGQFRKYPFPRIVANDGSYITEFYAWMYEPELPPLPDPAP